MPVLRSTLAFWTVHPHLSHEAMAFGRCSSRSVAVRLATLLVLGAVPIPAQQRVDVLIRGGMVIDGTGDSARRADVVIAGDKVVFVGEVRRGDSSVARVIAARGLIVAPGFIDPHTHTYGDFESDRADRRLNAAYLMQGVTTVITGNDGSGPVDVSAHLARWDAQAPWAKAIGAPELVAYLQGVMTLPDAISAAKAASRQYAKRQRTWLRRRMQGWTALPRPQSLA